MKLTLRGTRGSLARSGPETVTFGGDTACVEVEGEDGSLIVIDAGSGILHIGPQLPPDLTRIDLLISHLHMDHIQGLGFFTPLYNPDVEVHLWGPGSAVMDLRLRLTRYLSPPLFPVRLRELPGVVVHDLLPGTMQLGSITVTADWVCHPGPTFGFRLNDETGTAAYLSDHEPALGNRAFPDSPEWTSGNAIAAGADVLIHDAQYTDAEYADRVGWGHSTFAQAYAFAAQCEVRRLVTFHHDPGHSDALLTELHGAIPEDLPFDLVPGTTGATFQPGR